MIYCAKLKTAMLHLDPCLIRQEHNARTESGIFNSCEFCWQGLALKDAVSWLDGKLRPFRKRPINRNGGRRKNNNDVFSPKPIIKLGRPPQKKPLISKNNLFKQCQVCKKFKDKRDFTAHGSSRDGLNHTCVECRAKNRNKNNNITSMGIYNLPISPFRTY